MAASATTPSDHGQATTRPRRSLVGAGSGVGTRINVGARELIAPSAVVAIFLFIYEAADNSGGLWSTLFLFCALVAVFVIGLRTSQLAPRDLDPTTTTVCSEETYVRLAAWVALAMLPLLLSDRPYQRVVIYGDQTGGLTATVTLIALGAIVCLVRPPRARSAFGYLLAGALVLRGSGLDQWAIHPGARDMLPLVVSACEAFLAGENPYRLYAMQIGSEIPLTYPPLLWLAYLPTVAAGVDPRWTNWFCDAVIATAIAWPLLVGGRARAEAHAQPDTESQRGVPVSAAALVLVAAYVFSPDVHWNGVYAESHVDWAILAVLARALSMPNTRRATLGVLFGVALLTRPFNVIILPLLIVFLLRQDGLRSAARTLTISGAIAALGYLPFVLADPEMFYFGTVHWLLDFGPEHARWFREMIGLTGWLYEHDYEHMMPAAQLVVVTAGTCACMLWANSSRRFVAIVMMTYAGFVAFNSLIWMSFWISVALLAAIVVTAPMGGRPLASVAGLRFAGSTSRAAGCGHVDCARSARLCMADAPLVGAVVAVLAAGAVLLVLLAGTMRHDGEEHALHAARLFTAEDGIWLDWRGYRGALNAESEAQSEAQSAARPTTLLAAEARRGAASMWTQADSNGDPSPIDWTTSGTLAIVDRYGAIESEPWLVDAVAGRSSFWALAQAREVGDYRVVLLDRAVDERVTRWSERGALAELTVSREGVGDAEWVLSAADAEQAETDAPDAAADDATPSQHVFAGLADWTMVERRTCPVEGASRPMLRAHPLADGALLLSGRVPVGATVAVVTAALSDAIIEWHRADVLVAVQTTGRDIGRGAVLRVPNRRGMRTLDLPVRSGERFEILITTEDDGRRDLCMDVAFWR